MFTIVDISVKVVNCGEPVALGTHQKQEVKVGDTTGCGLVQLWEQNISLLAEGRSYKLKHFRIVEYKNIKSIAMCWEGSKVLPIEDHKIVINPPINAAVVEASCITLHKPKIAAVFKLETFFDVLDVGLGLNQLSAMR